MQSIITKQLGPTNTQGDRIKAKQSYGKLTVTIGYDYRLSNEQNHLEAAKALAAKANWGGNFVAGSLGADQWVFVNAGAATDGRMTFTQEEVQP